MRHRCAWPPLVAGHVVPVVTTGLHCGTWITPCLTGADGVVPVVTTGLHCGHALTSDPASAVDRRPRRHDGAPLRRCSPNRAGPAALGRPRRHDGAPLRPAQPRPQGGRHCRVVPVVTTGLHCGVSSNRITAGTAFVVPVATTGLHCGDLWDRDPADDWRGRPRRHDGAPLRRPTRRDAPGWLHRVVPVVTTGLHCGRAGSRRRGK